MGKDKDKTLQKGKENLQDELTEAINTYEDACTKACMTETLVDTTLKTRMRLIKELDEMVDITFVLVSKYASIKNCSLRQALDEIGIPDHV